MITMIILFTFAIGCMFAILSLNVIGFLNDLRFRKTMKMHETYYWLNKLGLRETADILCETIIMKHVPLHILRRDGYRSKKKRWYK